MSFVPQPYTIYFILLWHAGASTGGGEGEVDATCVQIGLRGGRELHPEGEEFPIYMGHT